MNRRDFLHTGFAGAVAPLFVGGLGYKSLSASVIPSLTCNYSDRALVIIYLAGANDIVNTTVPLDQLASYYQYRTSLGLAQGSLTTLDPNLPDNQQLGLHPSFAGFKNLYDAGKLQIVQRVGYPLTNRSHFVSEDIWFKGIDGTISNGSVETGWLGRFLMDRYPTFTGLPFGEELDPLGIILGDTPNTGFHTAEEHETAINLSGKDPAGFYNIISSLSGQPLSLFPDSEHGDLLQYIATLEKSTLIYSERISEIFNAGTNGVNYPDTELADQLKTVARFISGGSGSKVFMARKGGWDTHNRQLGRHASLLQEVSDAVNAFQSDLQSLGLEDRVTTVIFSEFARKVTQNGNGGTDHGTLSSMFLVGNQVNPGITGTNIDLADIDFQGATNPEQLEYDYRSVFASVLQDWMGAGNDSLLASFPQTSSEIVLNKVPLFLQNSAVSPACYFNATDPIQLRISVRLYLEGFLKADGTMTGELSTQSLLPTNQPYEGNPFGYTGIEQVQAFPEQTVDWILVELRNAQDQVLAYSAVLLREDGWLMDLSGNTEITLPEIFPESTYLVLFHRSHIGVKIATAVQANPDQVQQFDLSVGSNAVEGQNQLKLVHGKYALVAGDFDQNGLVNSEDYSLWKKSSLMDGQRYDAPDLNADGITDQDDFTLLEANRSTIGYPGTHTQLKN